MTYGAETLTLTQKSAEKVAQRAMERSMLGVGLRDRIPNEIIRQRTKVADVVERIATVKWAWAGHLARTRDDRWTKRVIEWPPSRSRGRDLQLVGQMI